MVLQNYNRETLSFTTNIKEALDNSEICFIAVGTPMGEDGSADLQYVLAVAKSIGENMNQHMYIIDKSTVPVGTADKVRQMIQTTLDERKSDLTFDVISNPEFLKEGAAVSDFMKPDRVVIGADNEDTFDMMRELYAPFLHNHDRLITMDIRSAEMTKYTANAMLATKISFMNEIANICERVGADVNQVRHGIGSDSRIGYSFIYPGCGYGGSCFPKDVQALAKTSKDFGYTPKLLDAVEEVNYAQKRVIREIRYDTGSGKHMNRLLQGDVGSGKTLVALMTMLLAIDNGFQAAIMAPTEILANQHFDVIANMLDGLDVNVALLTGSTKTKQRKKY
jgi:UDPglucose 6-dehydrogenase